MTRVGFGVGLFALMMGAAARRRAERGPTLAALKRPGAPSPPLSKTPDGVAALGSNFTVHRAEIQTGAIRQPTLAAISPNQQQQAFA